jgi:hypothetical protein
MNSDNFRGIFTKDNIWAEDVLNFLLWNAGKIINPSWRTWDRSFDDWVYRNSNWGQFHRLIQHQWVERDKNQRGQLIQL